jgi:hypothetical protein
MQYFCVTTVLSNLRSAIVSNQWMQVRYLSEQSDPTARYLDQMEKSSRPQPYKNTKDAVRDSTSAVVVVNLSPNPKLVFLPWRCRPH